MIRNTTATRRRAGFTLVELMVSAAVCVLIMAILTQAFVLSTDTMRHLKATGDMQDQLRAAAVVIREDLQQDRFLPEDGKENKGMRLSDQRLDALQINTATNTIVGWTPPLGGFFRVRSDGGSVADEGGDNDGLRSYRATNHYLHFTSLKPGGRDQDAYSATINGVALSSRAAELAFFLNQSPTGSTGQIPTYDLIRRQRLVAVTSLDRLALQGAATQPDGAAVVSLNGSTVNTMVDLTNPLNRLGGSAGLNAVPGPGFNDNALAQANGGSLNNRIGDDVLLSGVTSFQVQLLWTQAGQANGATPRGFGTTNTVTETTDAPFDFLPTRPAMLPVNQTQHPHNTLGGMDTIFDTWSSSLAGWNRADRSQNALPQRTRVKGVRIVLRVWDQKLKLSRQMTIVQDL